VAIKSRKKSFIKKKKKKKGLEDEARNDSQTECRARKWQTQSLASEGQKKKKKREKGEAPTFRETFLMPELWKGGDQAELKVRRIVYSVRRS